MEEVGKGGELAGGGLQQGPNSRGMLPRPPRRHARHAPTPATPS